MLVVAQKIVSKAEGRIVDVASVEPSPQASALAAEVEKDPRLVEVVLSGVAAHRAAPPEPDDRRAPARLRDGQCRHRPFECRARRRSGIERVLLLPVDPDASAERLRARSRRRASASAIAVIISDSFGRPFRRGTVGIALGAAGLPAVIDWRGQPDLFGRIARSHRDRLCRRDRRRRLAGAWARPPRRRRSCWCAASPGRRPMPPAAALVRPPEHDLFR